MSFRVYEFEFIGTHITTGEQKTFKATSTWRYGALEKLMKEYGKEWKFEY